MPENHQDWNLAIESFENDGMYPFETAMQEIESRENLPYIAGGSIAIFSLIAGHGSLLVGFTAYLMMRKKEQ